MTESIEEIKKVIHDQYLRNEKNWDVDIRRMTRKFHPMLLEDILHSRSRKNHVGLLITLSLFKNDFPWIYDLGKELIEVLKSKKTKSIKSIAVQEFKEILEFTFGHPMMREMYGNRKDSLIYFKEIPIVLFNYLERSV
ncbi:MAG TPA: hypothetical protein VK498_06090 [Ferruginibacter sp.]|nr:hypothetical protein [Ferruginibacter sp.]